MTTKIAGVRDFPIDHPNFDSLGLGNYAKALADFALTCATPITIGIQGDWGSGKTSLMQLIVAELPDELPKVQVNTWQYAQISRQANLALLMLETLHRKVATDPGALHRFGGKLLAVLKTVKKFEVVGFGVETGDEPASASETVALEELKTDFAQVVSKRLEGSGFDRLVIFIDDLDRVLPAQAVDILEVLKNFVDVPGCVFVIACDYEVVVKGLKEKFDVGANDLGGRSFFDKIIQVPFRMPVHNYEVTRYVGTLLETIGWGKLPPDEIAHYQALLNASMAFNPRSLKRLCNTLVLLKRVAELSADEEMRGAIEHPDRLKLLFGLVCMQTYFESAYSGFVRIETDKRLADLLFSPEDALQEEALSAVNTANEDDDPDPKLVEFLRAFGKAVDLDGDGTLDPYEVKMLRWTMKLSAITSVEEHRSQPRRSADELEAIAQKHGLSPLLTPLREVLCEGGLQERTTKTSFSYHLRWKPLYARKASVQKFVNLNVLGDDGIAVTLWRDRFVMLNRKAPHKDPCDRLMDHWDAIADEHGMAVFSSAEEVAQLVELLEKVKLHA